MTTKNPETDVSSARRAVAAILLSAALAGCAAYDGFGLKPGIATADDVRQTMGQPRNVYREPDGGESWEYPRGPQGLHTFMARLDKNRVLREIEQVLDQKGFARIEVGKSRREDVMRAIGSPWRQLDFPRRSEVVWDYRFLDVWGYPSQFSVVFDESGFVKQTFAIREHRRDRTWF